MRKLMSLVILLVIASLGWGAYWYVGSSTLERELGRWIDGRAKAGWIAEAATLQTRGFPNRFDTTFEALSLSDPQTGLSWSAPVFQLLQLSYKPNHVIAVWPGEQVFALAGQEITVVGDPLRASIEVTPDPALPLRAATIEAQQARLTSTLGETTLGAGQLSIRATPGAEVANSYDLFGEAKEIAPPAAWLAGIGAAKTLPARIAALRITATVVFDSRWDVAAIEQRRPQPRQIRVDRLTAHWGALALDAHGTLEVGADGTPSGTLDATAANWRALLGLIEASGKVDGDHLRTLTKGLELLATLQGDPETLEVPLGFRRGMMSIGPVPVGPAPKITLP